MKNLRRLKNFLTGQEAEEDEKKEENTETPETVQETSEETDKSVEAAPTAEEEIEKEEIKPETTVEEKEPEVTEEVVEATEEPQEEKIEAVKETEEPEIVEEAKKEEPKTKGSVNMTLLNKGENLVSPENVDPDFKQSIVDAGVETIGLCYQCGTCTGSCPSGRRTPYRIRSIIRKANFGLKDEVLNDETIWECVTCYACQERCPRGVAIVDVVKAIRNMQSQAGKMAQAHKMVGTFVLKTGHGVPINDATMELRKRVGLNKLPPTTHEFPEALTEVQNILKKTQFDSLIKYNWETGELE